MAGYRLEERHLIIRLDLEDNIYLFKTDYLQKVLEHIDLLARSSIRTDRKTMIDSVKELFDEDEQTVEALINIPATGIESYTFEDGAYYVHGINNSHVQVCSVCCIAHLVDTATNHNQGTYFCSDYCEQTDKDPLLLSGVDRRQSPQQPFLGQDAGGAGRLCRRRV